MDHNSLNVLSLFSGTQSWTKFYSKEDKVYNIDIEYLYPNTLCRDILTFDYKNEIKDKIDIIYASPPCNLYFTNMKQLKGNRKYTQYEKELSLKLVDKTIEIINYFNPKFFVIENPRAKMRTHYPEILGVKPTTVYYCMYGMEYMKPTDIWTNVPFITRGKCTHKKHNVLLKYDIPRGIVNDEQFKAVIPSELSRDIYNSIITNIEK